MLKKINKKGFTLAELLVVVAIIGILVAVSIPIFTAQLAKARLATNQANARAAYAATVAGLLDEDLSEGVGKYDSKSAEWAKADSASGSAASTEIASWTTEDMGKETYSTWYITIDEDGLAAINYAE